LSVESLAKGKMAGSSAMATWSLLLRRQRRLQGVLPPSPEMGQLLRLLPAEIRPLAAVAGGRESTLPWRRDKTLGRPAPATGPMPTTICAAPGRTPAGSRAQRRRPSTRPEPLKLVLTISMPRQISHPAAPSAHLAGAELARNDAASESWRRRWGLERRPIWCWESRGSGRRREVRETGPAAGGARETGPAAGQRA
jgi:hypothetical protein